MEVLMAYLRYQTNESKTATWNMNNGIQWLKRLDRIISENARDAEFDIISLAAKMELSERHLFRKVKELTNLSPKKYIRQYRLKLALNYLRNGTYKTVHETASAVGYANTSYFIKQFEIEFGRRPLKVLQEAGWR